MEDRLEQQKQRVQERLAARQQHQENMMALVLNCLTKSDHDGAVAAARELYDGDEQAKAVDLFYQHPPTPTPCPVCGSPVPWEVSTGFRYFQHKCQACEYAQIMANKAARVPEIMRSGGVPTRYHGAEIGDFSERFRKIDLSNGVFASGTPGTGKTHLLAAMFKKTVLDMKPDAGIIDGSIKNRYPVYFDFTYPSDYYESDFPLFINAPELLLSIKATFGQRGSETEAGIIEKYAAAPVLFLDDLGAEYSTEWAVGVMFLLIDRRYNAKLLTHITSNLSLEELAGRLNDRVTSRIAGMCQVVKMSGRDRRLSLVRAA